MAWTDWQPRTVVNTRTHDKDLIPRFLPAANWPTSAVNSVSWRKVSNVRGKRVMTRVLALVRSKGRGSELERDDRRL